MRLLIFLPSILIPAFDSFGLAFHMMYSAYKLNKQDDNIQPGCTPFPILNQFVVPCLVLTVASRPTFGYLMQRADSLEKTLIWNSHLFKNFLQFVVIHTVKDFSVVNEAKVDFFGIPLLSL